jgi:hypothetical protein
MPASPLHRSTKRLNKVKRCWLIKEERQMKTKRNGPDQWREERADRQQTKAAKRWLKAHMASEQPVKACDRRRMRMAQKQQRLQWEDKRNAPEIRRRNRQERIAQLRGRSETNGRMKHAKFGLP